MQIDISRRKVIDPICWERARREDIILFSSQKEGYLVAFFPNDTTSSTPLKNYLKSCYSGFELIPQFFTFTTEVQELIRIFEWFDSMESQEDDRNQL